MENNIKFRNHISIIIERMGSFFVIFFAMLIGGISQNTDELLNADWNIGGELKTILLVFGISAGIIVLIAGWQVVVWSKTYISIQDNTIVIERNTVNRKKNTIGIKNISNVNTEQNLFEMLIGTCKVKLDTNSSSTADKTDVKIVLKKAQAQNFKDMVMYRLQQGEGNEQSIVKLDENEKYDVEASLGDIITHGFFSMNLFSVLVVIGCIVGAVEVVTSTIGLGAAGKSLAGILTSLLFAAMFFFSAVWDIMKGFVRYYNFKVRRVGEKIYLKYGFFKKVNYTIPVDKIHAVKMTQSLLGRITGRYMAEIINVGMGDDEGEQPFFVLYCKKGQMEERLRMLLPEFAGVLSEPVKRQPGTVWAAWTIPFGIYALCTLAGIKVTAEFMPAHLKVIMAAALGITLLVLLCMICRFITAGSEVDEEFLKLSKGYFRRYYFFIRYDKIQYLETEQNFLAKYFGIQKGSVHLLASTVNRIQSLPYFREGNAELIKDRLLR